MTLHFLIRLLVWAEIFTTALALAAYDHRSLKFPSGSSAFDFFWWILWWPIAMLSVFAWIAVLRGWRNAFHFYWAGWIAAILYGLVSGLPITSPVAGTLGTLSIFFGGGIAFILLLDRWSIVSLRGNLEQTIKREQASDGDA